MDFVTWDQITAECDGYRAGFVAVFRKYEGWDTDKGKVTQRAFAEHLGISVATFNRWIKNTEKGASLSGRSARVTRGQMARQAIKSEGVSIEEKVGVLADLASDPRVMKAYREQRAPNVSPADAKAAAALAKAITDPIARSASKLQVPMWLDQLHTMCEVLSEFEFDEDEVRKLRRGERKLDNELTVQEFRFSTEDVVQ